jgi:hypothetical protein
MSLYHDCFGNTVSLSCQSHAQAIDHFMQEILSHGKEASQILTAAQQAPDSALLQAYTAALFLFLQTPEGLHAPCPMLKLHGQPPTG